MAEEKKRFRELPEGLREGWKVEDEKLNAWESDEVLAVRAGMATFSRYPEAQKIMDAVRSGKPFAEISLDLPEAMMPDFYFTIGAKGVSTLIAELGKHLKTNEDVAGFAVLTVIRHELLENNSSISYL